MLINGQNFHTIWTDKNRRQVLVIDQQKLPFDFKIQKLHTLNDAFDAIKDMIVRGAPLIGVTAAYGICLALENYSKENVHEFLTKSGNQLKVARPTAVNLAFVVDEMLNHLTRFSTLSEIKEEAWKKADELKQSEIDYSSNIGDFGLKLIEQISEQKNGQTVNILTHCNAGWLATIDWGTATAPIYKAQQKGIDVHVWVDETRPRNQGSKLTAFELKQMGIAHTIIADNTGGHLMQHGMVDMVIVGSDRTTATGDVCNKIGTYLKALAANDNNVPFYAALPSSTIDFSMQDGVKEIPIEIRNEDELKYFEGKSENGNCKVETAAPGSNFANYGFDVTPARLVTGLITEKGICEATEESISNLFGK